MISNISDSIAFSFLPSNADSATYDDDNGNNSDSVIDDDDSSTSVTFV
jgi:hypothetical protein